MELKYLTEEKLEEIKEIIRESIKRNSGLDFIELSNSKPENIEAYNELKKDKEFANIEFKLVDTSFATEVAKELNKDI